MRGTGAELQLPPVLPAAVFLRPNETTRHTIWLTPSGLTKQNAEQQEDDQDGLNDHQSQKET